MPFNVKLERRTELAGKTGLVFTRPHSDDAQEKKESNVTAERIVAAFGEWNKDRPFKTSLAENDRYGLLLALNNGVITVTVEDANPKSFYNGLTMRPALPSRSNGSIFYDTVETIVLYQSHAKTNKYTDLDIVKLRGIAEKLRKANILPQGEKRLFDTIDPASLEDSDKNWLKYIINDLGTCTGQPPKCAIPDGSGSCPSNPKTFKETPFSLRFFTSNNLVQTTPDKKDLAPKIPPFQFI